MKTSKNGADSILKALRYSNIFSYPLSFHQIAMYMDQKTSYEKLQENLRLLIKKKIITKRDSTYRLKNSKSVNWEQKQSQKEKLFKKYSELLRKLARVPWIQLLAITGSLAASNPQKGDDVDIFIATKKNRVWITRLFVDLYLKIWKMYRTNKEYSGKICPNLLVSEENLGWSKEKRNFFVASEIVRMQPIIDKNNTYLKFLTKNKWIKNYFPNFTFVETEKFDEALPNILDLIEVIFYFGQRIYMRRKMTTEEINKNFIHFNKNDNSEKILKKYKAEISTS